MPGPGQKKKTKPNSTPDAPNSARTSSSSGTPEPYVEEVDNAEGWSIIADILCTVYQLPDLSTRSGLKKVHANFDAIYRKLDKESQRYSKKVRIVGGIVGIYAKMCSDGILRDKLWDKGLLKKLLPLLDDDFTRHMALTALGTITHIGGVTIRIDVATHSSCLTKLLEQHPDDSHVADLVISVLSHALPAVLDANNKVDEKTLAQVDIRGILKMAIEVSKKDRATSWLIYHTLYFLASTTLHASAECKAYLPVQLFLVAGLRSVDWVTRCMCLGGLIRLHRDGAEEEIKQYDPNKLISSVHGFPSHLQTAMVNYGMFQCDTCTNLYITGEFQQALMTAAQDKNMYSLGIKLAEMITRNEFAISDGMFMGEDPRTGKHEPIDVGLPFTRYLDALPPCAKAIRLRGNPKEEDLADILDIKYAIIQHRIRDAVALAQKGIKRNPQQAYFYYAITLSANRVEGLKAAKKGVKCKQITPFIRFQLLQRAVEHAGDLGIILLQEGPKSQAKWEEGIAFLMSALEDAKTFVTESPPDNRHRSRALNFYILLTLAIKGPEMSEDLKELKPAIEAQALADDFMHAIQVQPPKTDMRLTAKMVVRLYTSACKEFGHIIAKVESDVHASVVNPQKAEDDLAAWLENVHVHDTDNDGKFLRLHPKVNLNSVRLYRCSHCGNPSAVLRKCSGCEKARYCDASCQKAHWKDHKSKCAVQDA